MARARLSLTPLIDVVFILLLFFMLASQLQRHGTYELQLPGAAPVLTDTTALVVIVANDGTFRLLENGRQSVHASVNNMVVSPDLSAAATNGAAVTVAGESEVSLQQLIDVMDELARAGFNQRRLAVEVAR